ncbi:hypothetical protein ACWNT8_15405 (plasmid) [Pigmentibacter ruber]
MTEIDVLDQAINRLLGFNFDEEVKFIGVAEEQLRVNKARIDDIYSIVGKIKEHKTLINKYLEYDVAKEINALYNILINLSQLSKNNNDSATNIADKIRNIFEAKKNEGEYKDVVPFLFHFKNLVNLATSTGVLGIDNHKSKLNDLEKNAQYILADLRTTSGSTGNDMHSENFKNIADEYRKYSEKWLCRTIILAVSLVVSLIFLFIYYSCTGNEKLNPNIIAVKIIFFTALLTATIWSANQYKILRNLYSVNLHKSISLQTFLTFVNAAIKEDTKDTILLECTKTIFVTPETGYIKSEEKNSETNIIEIMKNFKSSG